MCGEQEIPHPGLTPISDHPRACGEQLDITRAYRPLSGSPPRVRGTDYANARESKGRRITPACAGNRHQHLRHHDPAEDHPRVCGEQEETTLAYGSREGSPPRVRGTAAGTKGIPQSRRITPACAGNSLRAQVSRRSQCGITPACAGNSPTPSTGRPRYDGITPARAGNSKWISNVCWHIIRDHPRACGEQSD